MANTTIGFGAALILVGLVGYFGMGTKFANPAERTPKRIHHE
jgi:hypothetical protein